MSTFESVVEAVNVLERLAKKGKVVKEITDTIEVVSAALLSLNSDISLDDALFAKITNSVRYALKPLYATFPVQALKLSATVFSFLFFERVVPHVTSGNKALQANWEEVAYSLLSGVLDYIEGNNNDTTLALVASTLYPTLCRICFSPVFNTSVANATSSLKATAFSLLSESAQYNPNRVKLRNPDLLGGKRIGSVFYGCKEFLVLESLVYLISRILTVKYGSAENPLFLKDVFETPCPDNYGCAKPLIELFQQSARVGSDDLLSNTLDILAECNVFFPQPFELTEINACGVVLRQDLQHERLIVDLHSFFANIPLEDDQYDTFRIPYSSVHQISYSLRPDRTFTKVTIQTTSLPEYGSRSMDRLKSSIMDTVFDLYTADLQKFKEALDVRGVTENTRRNRAHKLQLRVSVAPHTRLEFGKDGDLVPDPPTFQEKVSTLGRAMELDDIEELSDPESPGEPAALFRTPLRSAAQHLEVVPTFQSDSSAIANISDPLVTGPARLSKSTSRSQFPGPPRAPSQFKIIQKSVFGDSGDELSEISDEDADSLKALSQKHLDKQAALISGATNSLGSGPRAAVLANRCVVDSDDEGHVTAIKRPTSTTARKKVVIEDSQEGMEKEAKISRQKDNDSVPSIPISKVARLPSSGRIEAVTPVSSPVDGEDMDSKDEGQKDLGADLVLSKTLSFALGKRRMSSANKDTSLAAPVKKRKRAQDENSRAVGDDEDLPLVKRLRSRTLSDKKQLDLEQPTDSQVLKKPRIAVAHKYGSRKGRTSSPTPLHSSTFKPDADFDEFPAALPISGELPRENKKKPGIALVTEKNLSGVATRTRAAAMKNKKNETAGISVAKPTKRTVPKAKPDSTRAATAGTKKKVVPAKLEEREEETHHDIELSLQDTLNVNMATKAEEVSPVVKVARNNKSAPWEEPCFESIIISEEPFDSIMDDTLIPVVEDVLLSTSPVSKVPAAAEGDDEPNSKQVNSPNPGKGKTLKKSATKTTYPTETTIAKDVNVEQAAPAKDRDLETKELKSKIVQPRSADEDTRFHKPLPVLKVTPRSSSPEIVKHTIDLTQENSPKLDGIAISSSHKQTIPVVSVRESVRERTLSKPSAVLYASPGLQRPPGAPTRSVNIARFASPTAKDTIDEFGGGTKNFFAKANSYSKPTPAKIKPTRRPVMEIMEEEEPTSDEELFGLFPEMQSIVNVMTEINTVMVHKVFGKLTAVKENAAISGSIILDNAVTDLQSMHMKIATQYDGLIGLEAAYATRGRKIAGVYGENVKINEELCRYMRKKIEDHDRYSLVKKMPNTLTARPIPSVLEKYAKK